MFLKKIKADIERLEEWKARRSELENLKWSHDKLRAEFDALVKLLNVEIKQVPTHHEANPR